MAPERMRESFRHLSIAALACLMVSGTAIARTPVSDGQKYDSKQAENFKTETASPADQEGRTDLPPDAGCKYGEDNRQSDLCAQWKAADAAAAGADYGWWQLAIGWIGVCLGALTMAAAIAAAVFAKRAAVASENTVQMARDASVDTIRALEASEAGAAAAVASVRHAEKVAFLQNRPWLIFETNQIWHAENMRIDNNIFKKGIGFTTVWKNVGRTPAVKAGFMTEVVSVPIDAAVPAISFDLREFSGQQAVIGPDNTVSSPPMGRGGDDYESLLRGESKLFIFAEFRYYSLLEDDLKFSTKVCLEVIFNGTRVDDNGKSYPHFDFKPIGDFNGAT